MSKSALSSFLRLPAAIRHDIAHRMPYLLPTLAIAQQHSTKSTTRTRQYASSASSVNQNEVAHFNVLASTWWDPQGSSRLLHLMNPLRHRFIQKCHANDTIAARDKLRYLDIGCGGGIFAESAARLRTTASVDAIDPTPEVIAVARRHQRQDPLLLEPGRLTYHNIPIEQLPLPMTPDQGYDVVSLFEVVEHIQNPSPFIESALQHLKPGGWLIGSTIARTAVSWFTTKFVAEDVIGMVPRGTHDWSQYIQPHELKAWSQKQDCLSQQDTSFMGVIYVPGIGWKEVPGSETWGNYFFAFRKKD